MNSGTLNLIDSFTNEFTGDTLARTASAVGESEGRVRAAVGGLGPAIMAALSGKASTTQGLTEVFDLMRNNGFDGSSARGLAGEIGRTSTVTDVVTRGIPLVSSIFGARRSSVIDWLASFAGIGSKSAASLLSIAVPSVLGLLGTAARKAGGFNPSVLGGLLASQGALLRDKAPAGLASALGLSDFSSLGILPDAVTRPSADVRPAPVVENTGVGWWPWLLIPLLLLLGWWWLGNRAPVGTVNPRLAITNNEGKIVCSASVRDETTSAAIRKALHAAFGDRTNCDIAIDANVKAVSWLPSIDRIFAALKRPGADFTLDGNAVQFGGWLSAADRKTISDELRGVFGTDYSLGEATDKAAAYVSEAGSKALAALTALGTTFVADSFVSAMNLGVINFPTGSSEIPADARNLIAQAATVLKTAPKGTAIEIGGHTDNVGDAASNVTLSQARADAVRRALVSAGGDGAMLVAKGYGDTKPVASNDSEYGRFRNRRIEYSVLKSTSR